MFNYCLALKRLSVLHISKQQAKSRTGPRSNKGCSAGRFTDDAQLHIWCLQELEKAIVGCQRGKKS
jgi:hypothetical protein